MRQIQQRLCCTWSLSDVEAVFELTIRFLFFFFLAKAKKAPAGAGKKGPFSEEEIPSSRRPRESPAPFSGGLGEGSGTSIPVLTEPSGK